MAVRMWLGGLLVALGGLWLLDATEVLDAGPVLERWWPLAVVALGAVGAVSQRRLGLGPVVVIGIGVVLLVDRLVETDVDVYLWPLLAVAVGVYLLLSVGRRRPTDPSSPGGDSTFALFGGSETRSRSPHFQHANVAAVMGGATLDLREARVDPGARVDALAVFGGVDVIVPAGTRVALHGLPVFGGYEDKTVADGGLPADAPVLDVSATAIFGAVEVKNSPTRV
ncbi:LiaF transmembrane domain-containing protein [Aquipuribacter sp. MA13-6]